MWNLNQNSTTVDILIKQGIISGAKNLLNEAKVSYKIVISDLQKAIESENPSQEEIEQLQNRKGLNKRYSYSL